MERAPVGKGTILVAVAVLGFAQAAHAACNVIPDAKQQLVGAPDLDAQAVALVAALGAEASRFGEVAYKGALGRIDRVYLARERPGPIRVAADGVCVGRAERRPFALDHVDDLVAAMIVTDGSGRRQATVASGRAIACQDLSETQAQERLMDGGCKTGGIVAVEGRPEVLAVSFPERPPTAAARPARMVVLRASSPGRARQLLAAAAARDCATLCADPDLAGDFGVCIDDIFAPTGLTTGGVVAYTVQDMAKCELMETPSPIPWNDFKRECQDGAGATGPACDNTLTTVSMWEDGCHNVYIPFDWTRIRHTAPGGTADKEFDRVVRGQSGISVKGEAEGGRIWVPGREFVGTLAEADVSGTGSGFSSDPRRAEIDVWYPTKEEVGLTGITDKDKSIIYAVPRLPVSRLCDTTTDEACTGVPTNPDDDATRCACRDRYAADCTCVTVSTPRLFQCSGTAMPCTRHAHCNPGQLCNTQPTCRQDGEVWTSPVGVATTTLGAKCWSDAHCKDPNTPGFDPSLPQCGYLLFNLGAKRETGKSEIVVKPKLTGGGKKRRGVCKKTGPTTRVACSNSAGSPACTAAQGDCTEYVLEALAGTEVVP